MENRLLVEYFSRIMTQKMKHLDWYDISVRKFEQNGGDVLLREHGHSLQRLLKSIYPNFHWLSFKFMRSEPNYWNAFSNHKLFFDWTGAKLGFKSLDSWYQGILFEVFQN